jgi:hypothetical protein
LCTAVLLFTGFFRNVSLQVTRVSYSSIEGTKPINKRFYKLHGNHIRGGEMTKKEELNNSGATETEY